ncbi:unnamed protein product [Ascophyllum nodosum]
MMTTLPFSSTGASQQGQSQAEIVVGGYPPGHCQEGNDQNEELVSTSKWAFPSSQVLIHQGEDHVLGRGSYGEVRTATWRGLRVAAKQLHALSISQGASLSVKQAAEMRRDLLKEMSLLASLRHPNLVLFLGITYDEGSKSPLSIITELMPSSVYDLLETRGVVLELPEVLDLASDICGGLVYLHEHSPTIVHRDLSSRNVLYDGRTAKLADLGQAKVMGLATAGSGSRQTAMPGAMVCAAPEVLTGRYTASIDLFSFGVLLAQLITREYNIRSIFREYQVAGAGDRFPLLKPLLERCLSLHAEDRLSASEAMRAVESLRADPCAYRPAGHGAGILADRWFQEEQKERCRVLDARLHVYERRLSAEIGRWKEEADKADIMSASIGAAERDRDHALKRCEELEESMAGVLSALDEERSAHDATRRELKEANNGHRHLEGTIARLDEDLLRSQRALKSAKTLQGLAEGNTTLANRTAAEAKETREKAELNAAQAEAQLSGQVAATREVEARLGQAISRWEGEKIDRLRFEKGFFAKCSEAKNHEQTVRDLRTSLKYATDRLSKYDGLAESQQIRQRMLELEADRKRASDETATKERHLKESTKDVEVLTDKARLGLVEEDRDKMRRQCAKLEEGVKLENEARNKAEKRYEKEARALAKAQKQIEEGFKENARLKEEFAGMRKEIRQAKGDAPWLFRGSSRDRARVAGSGGKSDGTGVSTDPGGANNIREESSREEDHPAGLTDQGEILGSDISSSDAEESARMEALVDEAVTLGPVSVTRLLQRHPKRQNLQRRGLRALRDLAFKGDDERRVVVVAGGVTAVVQAMEHFPTDLKVQTDGIKTLAHLAFGNDFNRIEVGSCGGTGAIVRAMAAFPADSELQGEACTAMTNSSHNCDRNRILVIEAGGLVLVLDAMQARAFPGLPKLQQQACWALLTLAANDEISRMIASEGGVGAIIAAMINNAGDTGVQHFGCWALANVAWGQPDMQKFAKEEGALEAIQTAVDRFPTHQALVDKARLASSVILSTEKLAIM